MRGQPVRTFYEFFAGGGMARAGLGDGWTCLLANDNCEKKAASYAANWGDDELVVGDVNQLTTVELPGIADLAWASFPCQDLSLAGNGAGLRGERSGAFWGFWNLVKQLAKEGRKPPVLALENVYGILTSHEGEDFTALITALIRERYRVGAMVVDGVHFVPQSRPRVFIVAVDERVALPKKIQAAAPNPAWHPAAIIRAFNRLPKKVRQSWCWWNMPAPKGEQRTLEDIVELEPQGVDWNPPDLTAHILEMMTPVNRRKVLAAQASRTLRVGTIYRRTRDGVQRAEVRFDGIAGCLRTPAGGSSRQTIIVVDGPNIRTRLLSPRETARLMGLDDTYMLPIRYNDAYSLAGDGLVVPAVAHVARSVIEPAVDAARMPIRDWKVA
jgi:DNA (cytosine-5)-methyltransferase 1